LFLAVGLVLVFFTLHFSKPKKKGKTRLGDEERRLMHLVPAPAVINIGLPLTSQISLLPRGFSPPKGEL
jgi:hypothetical protein